MAERYKSMYFSKRTDEGVTIVELLVVIFIIGTLIAFIVPSVYNRAVVNARNTATKAEMNQLRSAIMGNPELISGGEFVATGFKSDVGRLPRDLMELVTKPTEADTWNPFTKHGWNGPYVRDDGTQGFLKDAWGEPYQFVISGSDTLGLKSPGSDGEWYGSVPGLANDDIQILF
jgi:type II secretory pathway pseudopilin PulG